LQLWNSILQGQEQQVALPQIDFRELREQAATTADLVKQYSGRVLDTFLSERPEWISQQALSDEVLLLPNTLPHL